MSLRMKLGVKTGPYRTSLLRILSVFTWFTKIKISQQLLGVGSSALDMFQMTFQFVQIRGVFIIRTFFPYEGGYLRYPLRGGSKFKMVLRLTQTSERHKRRLK